MRFLLFSRLVVGSRGIRALARIASCADIAACYYNKRANCSFETVGAGASSASSASSTGGAGSTSSAGARSARSARGIGVARRVAVAGR